MGRSDKDKFRPTVLSIVKPNRIDMEGSSFIGLLFWAVIIYFGVRYFRRRAAANKPFTNADENTFSQNGVTVDFANGRITINGHSYSVNQVTGIRSEMGGKALVKSMSVVIKVDDFNKPIHKVVFKGFDGIQKSEEFMQRLTIALRKAGGPSFA